MIATLRAEPLFARWALAESVTMVGTATSNVVLPVLVYDLTGSAGLAGLLFATRLVPYLLLGLIAGPVADRANRRWLIIGGNLAEGTLAATIPIAALLDVLTVGQIFVVALLSAVAFVFSDAAVFGAVPALVHPDRLPAANGLLSTLASSADIAGPVLAGALIATVGPANAIGIDAASFGAAATVQLTIKSSFRREPSAPPQQSTVRGHLRTAFAFVRQQRTILTLMIAGFGNSLAFGIILGLLVPWSVEVLGYQRDDARLGILYAAIGVGSLLAGTVFSKLFAPHRVRLLTPATLTWSAVTCFVLLVATAWSAPVNIGVFSFGIMLTITIGITYRQLATPDHLTSTVSTVGRMVAAGGVPLGAAAGALVATVATVTTAYAIASTIMAITALSAFVALRVQDTRITVAAAAAEGVAVTGTDPPMAP